MILTYEFSGYRAVEFPAHPLAIEPDYQRVYGEWEYEYDCDPTPEDLCEYLEEDKSEGALALAEEILDLYDDLEFDDDWVEFLKGKYEEKAYKEFMEEEE